MKTKKVLKKYLPKRSTGAFYVNIEMFNADIVVVSCPTDLVYYFKKVHDVDFDLHDFAHDPLAMSGSEKSKDGRLINFIMFTSTCPSVGVIAHESVHTAVRICEEVGVPITVDTDETLAYMVDYLTQTIYDHYREMKND